MSEGSLLGATVQRVDVGPEVVLLRVRAPGQTGYVIVAAGRRGGVGVTAQKPWKGAGLPGGVAPEGERTRYRTRLEGARLFGVGERWIALLTRDACFIIEADRADGARVTLRPARAVEAIDATRSEEAIRAEGARLAAELGEGAILARRQAIARAIGRAGARVARRIEAVRGDLGRIGAADDVAARAALFVAEAARAPRGAARLVVTDWSTGEPLPVELPLDPARSAREQVEAMFKRARRLKLGRAIAERRLHEAEAMATRLADAAAQVAGAPVEALDGVVQAARAAAPRDFALADAGAGQGRGASAAKAAPSRPYRTFAAEGGARILVGKGAASNDGLTFHVGRPHDLWLHAKGRTGAHVIVPLPKNQSCPGEVLVDAAHLAAHFSEAREEAVVEVQHTPRRYLRKPKGSAPGLVLVDREKVLVLRVERERLARLLAAEEL
jgi:hypothetical protein